MEIDDIEVAIAYFALINLKEAMEMENKVSNHKAIEQVKFVEETINKLKFHLENNLVPAHPLSEFPNLIKNMGLPKSL
jgi:uncharacterized membrane protein YukC